MGSIPGQARKYFEHAFHVSFAGMILNKCVVLRIGTLTGGLLCRERHPLCRLQNSSAVYRVTCRRSSCKICVYNVHLLIILERGCSSMYRKKMSFIFLDQIIIIFMRPLYEAFILCDCVIKGDMHVPEVKIIL